MSAERFFHTLSTYVDVLTKRIFNVGKEMFGNGKVVLSLRSFKTRPDWNDVKSLRGGIRMAKYEKGKKPLYKRISFWTMLVIVVAVIANISGGKSSEKRANTPSTTETSTAPVPNDATNEQKNALRQAASYAGHMHMSKAGIFDQLTSEYGEKFNHDDATWAIEHLKTDYNKNALAKAKDYANQQYMSKNGIYDQLMSEHGEKFLSEEAQYAVDNLQADYNENAHKKAEQYQKEQGMSSDAIYDQLKSEYGEKFTPEEAQYAVRSLQA